MTTTLKMLAAALLIASPASLGLATYSDQVTVPLVEDGASAQEAEVIASYEETYDQNLTTGELDLRIDEGEVRIVGWANNSVRVEVLQTPTDDDRTTATIEDSTSGSHLNLSVIVDREERTSVRADIGPVSQGDDPDRAIVAHVPMNVAYESVYACEGETSMVSETVHDALDQLPGSEETPDHAPCVPADGQPETGGTIGVNSHRSPQLDIGAGVFDLQGDTLKLAFDNADLGLDRTDFASAAIETDNGDITGTEVTVGELKAVTDNGDIDLAGALTNVHAKTDNGDLDLRSDIAKADLTTDNGEITVVGSLTEGSITTDNGDVILQLTPETSGSIDVTTDNGDAALTVPETPRHGYDITGTTDNGDVTIGLDDVRKTGTDEDEGEEDETDRNRVHARTHGFEDREIQLTLSLSTDNGDIWVTDASDAVEDDGEQDDGDEEGSGTTIVRTPDTPPLVAE